MKIKKFENFSIKKSKMQSIKGGISNTQYCSVGVMENEQEIDGNGKEVGKPLLIEISI